MRYKIGIKTLQGNVLTFNVDCYSIIDGFVSFTDNKTNSNKRFPISNCEITEVLK